MPTYYVAELHEGLLNQQVARAAPPTLKEWRFFAPCEEDSFATCTLLCKDMAGFKDARTKKDLWRLLKFVFEAGKGGAPWKEIFQDGKQFHPVHKFDLVKRDGQSGKTSTQTVEVHQFKKMRTDVRVLFVYAGGRPIVFITQAFEKRSEQTPQAEQARAEREAKSFLQALDNREIRVISEQGGQDETNKTFY